MAEQAGLEKKEIERLVIEDQETEEAILKTMQLLRQLNQSGLLDLLLALTDKEVVHRLMDIAVSTGLLKIADKIDQLPDKMAQILDALEEPTEPMYIYSLLKALSDPEVARGLARVIKMLKIIGSW